MNHLPLRVSHPSQEGISSFSKWSKLQFLIDDIEMRDLLLTLSPLDIFPVGSVVEKNKIQVDCEEFFQNYKDYINFLKKGIFPEEPTFRFYFSTLLTKEKEALYLQEVGKERYLVKSLKPVIQFQLHSFYLSDADGKFYPMVLSQESIPWGIQCSYPQIFQEGKSAEFVKVDNHFFNTQLFQLFVQWIRKNTVPTPFLYRGVKTNVPIRLGKSCFSWISSHPGLLKRGLTVANRAHFNR